MWSKLSVLFFIINVFANNYNFCEASVNVIKQTMNNWEYNITQL